MCDKNKPDPLWYLLLARNTIISHFILKVSFIINHPNRRSIDIYKSHKMRTKYIRMLQNFSYTHAHIQQKRLAHKERHLLTRQITIMKPGNGSNVNNPLSIATSLCILTFFESLSFLIFGILTSVKQKTRWSTYIIKASKLVSIAS